MITPLFTRGAMLRALFTPITLMPIIDAMLS